MKRIPILALAILLLGAQDCEPPKPSPQGGNEFCYGNNYSVMGSLRNAYSEVGSRIDAIFEGQPSLNRRSTVMVNFGQSYCTGTIVGPRVVLTAGHCGYGATTAHTVRIYERGGAAPTEGAMQEPELAYADARTGERVDAWGRDTFTFNAAALDAADGLVIKQAIVAAKHIVHPDYLKYVYGGNTDLEARKADLMVLIMGEDLPGPFPAGIYNHVTQAQDCQGGIAQGFGRNETGGVDLRETKYVITDWSDPHSLHSRRANLPEGQESGVICYGDSGGPFYLDVDGELYVGGATSTTMSSDCMAGGTHVNVHFYRQWLKDTATAEGAALAFEVGA